MPNWQLDPIDPKSNNWRASTYSGRVIIRAPNEQRAHEIANRAFGIVAVYLSGTDTPLLPWVHSEIVECRKVALGSYEEVGPDEILYPSEYDSDWRR